MWGYPCIWRIPGRRCPGALAAAPAKAVLFALGMLIVMTSMGLYQPDLWREQAGRSACAWSRLSCSDSWRRGCFAYVVPSLHLEPHQIAGVVVLALAGSALVRTAFHKWSSLGVFKSRVLVLGTGSRVMRLAEFAQRNPNHVIVGYVSLQPARALHPAAARPADGAGRDAARRSSQKHGIDQIVIAVRDRRGGGFPVQELLECRLKGVKVTELPTFFEREHRQMLLESLNPSWMVLGDGFRQGLVAKHREARAST